MATKAGRDEVDQAVAAVRRAIDRLVQLLGDADFAVITKAALALAELGAPAIIGSLAAALPRAPSPRHRAAIIGALLTCGSQARSPVLKALIGAVRRDPDPHIRAAARAALVALTANDLKSAVSARRDESAKAATAAPG
jgi:HEAT repeat protein